MANQINPKFELGRTVVTSGALASIPAGEILASLRRHLQGDWGELDTHDTAVNERALREGGRLLSRYFSSQRVKFYIITEWDRSQTTVLLSEEY